MSWVKENQKKLIVGECCKMFLEKSIEEVKISDVAARIGLGEATIYRYFGKKENLVVMCAIQMWNDIEEKYFSFVDGNNGYEKIYNFYKQFLNIYENDKAYLVFLNDFDNYVINKKISNNDLNDYNNIIMKTKEAFDVYFNEGINDHSIDPSVNNDLFYFSTCHALLTMGEKFSKYNIIQSDEIINGREQINYVLENQIINIRKKDGK